MAKSAWGRGGGGRVGAEAKKAVLAKRRAEARWWSRGRGAGCGPDDDGGRQRQQPRWGDNEREATTTRRHMVNRGFFYYRAPRIRKEEQKDLYGIAPCISLCCTSRSGVYVICIQSRRHSPRRRHFSKPPVVVVAVAAVLVLVVAMGAYGWSVLMENTRPGRSA
uniref:Uncharacterized protein n=1 Tax=Oryza sativa subsp. japonica TaxID=39947 RepID=Q339W3_ORYSJ|nr:hypothetical protein LOC_Os10g17880 [Oryza sativa Japonica Group]